MISNASKSSISPILQFANSHKELSETAPIFIPSQTQSSLLKDAYELTNVGQPLEFSHHQMQNLAGSKKYLDHIPSIKSCTPSLSSVNGDAKPSSNQFSTDPSQKWNVLPRSAPPLDVGIQPTDNIKSSDINEINDSVAMHLIGGVLLDTLESDRNFSVNPETSRCPPKRHSELVQNYRQSENIS